MSANAEESDELTRKAHFDAGFWVVSSWENIYPCSFNLRVHNENLSSGILPLPMLVSHHCQSTATTEVKQPASRRSDGNPSSSTTSPPSRSQGQCISASLMRGKLKDLQSTITDVYVLSICVDLLNLLLRKQAITNVLLRVLRSDMTRNYGSQKKVFFKPVSKPKKTEESNETGYNRFHFNGNRFQTRE
jgi:hypothetical protein